MANGGATNATGQITESTRPTPRARPLQMEVVHAGAACTGQAAADQLNTDVFHQLNGGKDAAGPVPVLIKTSKSTSVPA